MGITACFDSLPITCALCDEKGPTNPHYLKHWKFFVPSRDFLRDRYAQYEILQNPTLFFDSLVPEFQDPMRYGRVEA